MQSGRTKMMSSGYRVLVSAVAGGGTVGRFMLFR